MRNLLIALLLAAAVAPASGAFAAERTATFAVENMTCASCPYIVRKSMAAVPGVMRVDVSFETKAATVTYDDAKTTTDAIAGASAHAGYPARPQGS